MDDAVARTLTFVRRHIARHGESPPLREIARETGTSVSAAHGRIRWLMQMGYLEQKGRSWRLRLVPGTPENRVVRIADVRHVVASLAPGAYVEQIVDRLMELAEDAPAERKG